jgi:hypothetical protein
MDSVATVSSRIFSYVLDGQPSKALVVAARYQRKPEYRKDLMFCLNSAVAAVRSKSPVTMTTQTPRYYRGLAKRCSTYDVHVEGNFWYTNGAIAEQRGNLPAALKMYRWVLKLDPGENRQDVVSRRIEKIKQELLERKLAKLPSVEKREDVAAKPRHSQ